MKTTTYIYQHLGLGDHFICNGLVRRLVRGDRRYRLFAKPHNLPTVAFMFRDLPNIEVVPGDDHVAVSTIQSDPAAEVIQIGFREVDPDGPITWDESFYLMHGVDFSVRWDGFHYERDLAREEALLNMANPGGGPFVLVHSTGSDGVDRVDWSLVRRDVEVIRVSPLTDNMLDWRLAAERAQEVHCVESSFHVLVDSLDLPGKPLFFHTKLRTRYARHRTRPAWAWV